MYELRWRLLGAFCAALIVGMLAGCAGGPAGTAATQGVPPAAPSPSPSPSPAPGATGVPGLSAPGRDVAGTLLSGKSRWVPVAWTELPGLDEDPLYEAWNAWIKSCERPGAVFASLCPQVRMLSLATVPEQRSWMMEALQPYRVEAPEGSADGLLTAYFEPVLVASRLRQGEYQFPLYRPPPGLAARKPWFTRQEMDTLPQAQAVLRGQEIAWLADPVDALVLQIQGSGRLRITEADGQVRMVRLAFAATNDQPYGSVGRWLLDKGLVRDASWPGIRGWLAQNPQRLNELLWSNPRMVFFREESLSELEAGFGPRGAQGVPLTPGRSIAVDRESIPYGTPVWLASAGPFVSLRRLVMAQDTGSAITGAVRADYFAGWGPQAGDLAGRLKQSLQMWVLWPKRGTLPP